MVFLRKAGNARRKTVRQRIITLLEDQGPGNHGPGGGPLSALEISGYVGVAEKEVYEHLVHIQRSVNKSGDRFKTIPAECRQCGFVFRKRERLKKPGRCPVCRSESIQEPLFSIVKER
jgi:predicted Zn-ribbon and HTH transcriptional regulator